MYKNTSSIYIYKYIYNVVNLIIYTYYDTRSIPEMPRERERSNKVLFLITFV